MSEAVSIASSNLVGLTFRTREHTVVSQEHRWPHGKNGQKRYQQSSAILMAKLSLAKLERHLYAAADRLRQEGLDAATYKDFIFGMLFLKPMFKGYWP